MVDNMEGPYRVDYVTIEKNGIHSMILLDKEKKEIIEAFKGIDTWTECIEYLYNFYYSRHHLELIEKESDFSDNIMGRLYVKDSDIWVGNITFKKIPGADRVVDGIVPC